MTKGRLALLGSAMIGAVLLGGASVASAQYYSPEYDRYYDDRTETIVRFK